MIVRLHVNGKPVEVETSPLRTLLSVLREELGLTGAKEGCGMGDCGACTVLADGQPVNACLLLAPSADGLQIQTIEGLSGSPVQEAFVQHDAVQCGFCTPGMILAAHALLTERPEAGDEEIRHGLSGNLCRCTGYQRILAAVSAAAAGKGGRS